MCNKVSVVFCHLVFCSVCAHLKLGYAGSAAWNALPASLHEITDTSIFKQEAQLPQRDFTSLNINIASVLQQGYLLDSLNSYRHYQSTNRVTYVANEAF